MIWIIVIGIFIALLVVGASETRKKVAAERKMHADTEQSVRLQFKPDELFYSQVDGHFVGFLWAKRVIIIGDLSGTKEYNFSDVTAVELLKPEPTAKGEVTVRVTVDDRLRPVHEIRLFRPGNSVPSSFTADQAVEVAERLKAHLLNVMRKSAQPAK